jgi:4-hydroxythreonine-4-phosphate dehydrogenase
MIPTLAITLGDPAGVGPEVVAKALFDPEIRRLARFVVYGDAAVLDRACLSTRLRLDPVLVTTPGDVPEGSFGLAAVPGAGLLDSPPGTPDLATGAWVRDALDAAVRAALAGEVDGLVTGPINKEALSKATGRVEGHTELLARLTGSASPVMMLAGPTLKVVSATSHARLADVPGRITADRIEAQGRVLADGLRRFFCLAAPRIAVCALNPHRGEGGLYGDEEARVIVPAIRSLCTAGVDAVGPEPADTVFLHASRGRFDAVLAMYHDQAMIPLKLLHFETAINVTLGLPIVRVSPGHGTAYDIAGTGTADAASMKSAIRVAAGMARCAARP